MNSGQRRLPLGSMPLALLHSSGTGNRLGSVVSANNKILDVGTHPPPCFMYVEVNRRMVKVLSFAAFFGEILSEDAQY